MDHKVARFRQVDMHDQQVHHNSLEFPDGQTVLVTRFAHRSDWDCTSITAAAHDHVRSKPAEERRLRSLGTTKRPVGRHIRRPTLAILAMILEDRDYILGYSRRDD